MTILIQILAVLGVLLGAFASSYYIGIAVGSLIEWAFGIAKS